MRRAGGLALLLLLSLAAVIARARSGPDRFDHAKHAKLFPSCTSCHAGITDTAAMVFPAPSVSCAACHDGTIQRTVNWTPRAGPPPSNLAFVHATHPKVAECGACHSDPGATPMQVHPAVPATCFSCHGNSRVDHLAQSDTLCATCHTSLAKAPASLAASMVGGFPRPPSHHADAFGAGGGHGRLAERGDRSCATCHAQEYCTQCHIDRGRNPAIDTMASDPRALAVPVAFRAPASHRGGNFQRGHGALARQHPQQCATCHTQESCTSCHPSAPSAAQTLRTASAGAAGALVVRTPPTTHQAADWASGHGALASARPQNCAGCHARTQCLECHRPDAGTGERAGFHPRGFIASHPAAAYGRETSCAECHNTQSFCQSCHVQAGVVASGRLRGGFHDGRSSFLFGHGQAARQSLESCVSCHAERDCLACHSAARGRAFDPHGPGFDAERLKRKNPGMCVACHVTPP